jgi:hypothetical protein
MSKKAACRLGKKRTAARLRLIRRKAAAWQRGARKALTLALIAGCLAEAPSQLAYAQMGGMGQGAMAPSGGVVNRAIGRLQDLNQNGPGWMYYGINAADRGLGYNGSYMTLGGFIPYAEDDLGGFWAADLRGHFSEYGGFFSNVGFVRKQFLGGSLFGVGVYWDYDGDQNQYSTAGMCGTGPFGQFGHSYNQVGISTEWLTDFGNLRSNGYIPVGTTAYTAGNPGSNFYQNFVMCQYGLDAALTGADLEVGAYVPGLSDWAGMISVGGYALGNARYDWSAGSLAGKDVVPWFGGVYTRLDMTLIENWDFSLQYNNDSFFDSTGFARLTYRMGGSRRRNVPDQMEQPMMRNEHIVRAHQTPEVAINPSTGTPWNVIHVNNAYAGTGNGTAASPFTTIAAANAAATNAWDIVFVGQGNGNAYDSAVGLNTTFTPLAANQYLIGDGAAFYIPSVCCGDLNIATLSSGRPLLNNPTGASIEVTNGLVVNNFDIQGSEIGILGTGNLSSGARDSLVTNVAISGTQKANQTGVFLADTTGGITFDDVSITDMTNGGFVVAGGDPNVTFNGDIRSNVATNGGFVSPIIAITETTGGTIAINKSSSSGSILDIGGEGILIANTTGGTANVITIGNAKLVNSVETAVLVDNASAFITLTDAEISKETLGAAIRVNDGDADFAYFGKITNKAGYLLEVTDTVGGAVLLDSPPGSPFQDTGDGILVKNADGEVTVLGANITSQKNGIAVSDSVGGQVFNDITIGGAGGPAFAGVNLQNNTGPTSFNNLNITTNNATGFLAANDAVVNVTGNSTVTSTGAPAVSLNNVADANINFNSVKSTDSSAQGVFINKTNGKFNVSGGVTITTPTTDGFVVQNSADLEVNVPTLTAVTGSGIDGIKLVNNNQTSGTEMTFGTINVSTGNASTSTLGGRGLVIQSTGTSAHGLVTVGGGTIDAYGGASLDISNADVNIRLASAASESSSGNGLNILQASGSVDIAQTSVSSPTGNGINAVDNAAGFTADFGTTSVTGIDNGAIGVNLTNATTPAPSTTYSFDSLSIQTVDGTGLRTKNAGTVNFNSPASITAAGGAAIDLENTTGTTNGAAGFTFLNLTSTDSPNNGIRLHNLNSDLTVTGLTTVNGASGPSVSITDDQSPAGDDTILFNTVQIVNRNNVGLYVDGINGLVQVANLQIDNANNVAGNAVEILNTNNALSPSASGRVYINGGSIDNSGANGIAVSDALARITGVTIAGSASHAVFLTASGAGTETTVSVLNSTLSNTAGLDGIRAEASGGGIVNVTALTNLLDVALQPINVIVFDSSSEIYLNASGNFGAAGGPPGVGAFELNNLGGGVLDVYQASAAALSTANNGATVINNGATFGGPLPPTP